MKIKWPDFQFPPINLWNSWPWKYKMSKKEVDNYMEYMYDEDVSPNINRPEEDSNED